LRKRQWRFSLFAGFFFLWICVRAENFLAHPFVLFDEREIPQPTPSKPAATEGKSHAGELAPDAEVKRSLAAS